MLAFYHPTPRKKKKAPTLSPCLCTVLEGQHVSVPQPPSILGLFLLAPSLAPEWLGPLTHTGDTVTSSILI